MTMMNLIMRMKADADKAWQREVEEERLLAIQRKSAPKERLQQKNRELRRLESQTATLKAELRVREQLKTAYQRHAELSLQLKEANMTLDERQERDAEIDRMQILFSRVCPEASPSWRQEANLAFKSRYAPTGKKV